MSKIQDLPEYGLRNLLTRALLVLGTVAIIVLAMPRDSRESYKIEKGKPWRYNNITAPFDFPIYKSEKTVQAERDSALRHYEPYFNYDKDMEGEMTRKFVSDFADGIPGLPDDYISIIANRLHSLYQRGIVSATDYAQYATDTARIIRIVTQKQAASLQIKDVFSTKTAYQRLLESIAAAQEQADTQQLASQLAAINLNDYIQPNLICDTARTATSRDEMLAQIPLASGVVQRGQKIIDQGDVVDEQTYRVIDSFNRELERRRSSQRELSSTVLGDAIYVLVLTLCFTLYIEVYRRDYFERPRCIAMVFSLIIVFALLTALFVRHPLFHIYMLPYAMLPIFVRTFLDSRTAFVAHATCILVCALMLQRPFEFIAVEMAAGLVAILSLRELSQRSQLFRTAIYVTATAAAMHTALELIHVDDINKFDASTFYYIAAAGVALLFAYPLMYVLEKLFGFISNITLIELSNTNNDLLRRMSEVAPGTFQHSIQVGNLAAEIANKIGAKSQLVRTGALYHDIGKTLNPIYFTENQSGVNPHTKLSPIESAQIIISHVTEGLKLAEKNNLPSVIKDFISTHHGQGKAKYFFIKYKNEHPDEAVDELLFTYPGPNPFTREQAILMMADTVEAASRSLPEYTDQAIRELVDKLIDQQVADGYFRDCPITFQDISYAKTVLVEKLKTIYHTRIAYPEAKREKKD